MIEEEEGAAEQLAGWRAGLVTLPAVAVSLFHRYAAYGIVPAQVLRPVHVGVVLLLTSLLFPMLKSATTTASCGGTWRVRRWRWPRWST